MFLKFIRHRGAGSGLQRGTLYSVHFQPNEKGGYNEHRTSISDAYEIPCKSSIINHKSSIGGVYPLPLIYPAGVVRINGFMRLTAGDRHRRAALHLINRDARERLCADVLRAIHLHEEVRIEVSEADR